MELSIIKLEVSILISRDVSHQYLIGQANETMLNSIDSEPSPTLILTLASACLGRAFCMCVCENNY